MGAGMAMLWHRERTGAETMRAGQIGLAALALSSLSGCNSTRPPPAVAAMAAPSPAIPTPAGPIVSGPLLGPDGRCTEQAVGAATIIEPGIAECDLVRLKGKPATDVLIGESGKGQREVQVLYAEPGGRELYFFVNNRLDRIVR
jgi:hypothetical protein